MHCPRRHPGSGHHRQRHQICFAHRFRLAVSSTVYRATESRRNVSVSLPLLCRLVGVTLKLYVDGKRLLTHSPASRRIHFHASRSLIGCSCRKLCHEASYSRCSRDSLVPTTRLNPETIFVYVDSFLDNYLYEASQPLPPLLGALFCIALHMDTVGWPTQKVRAIGLILVSDT